MGLDMNELSKLFGQTDTLELTDELIKKLVKDGKWGDEESLKDLAKQGGRWNVERESITFPGGFF